MTEALLPADVAGLSYEQAVAELDKLISSLEEGNVPLADAVALYERGVRLSQRCTELLEKTDAQISELMVSGNGATTEKPLQVELEKTTVSSKPANGSDARGAAIDPDEIPF